MSSERLTWHFILLRALRWLPIGLVLPFLIITPVARGLSLGAVGAVFAVHSAVAMLLEVPSGALADSLGRRRVMLVGATLTAASLVAFAFARNVPAFMASVAALAGGRALISGALEAWYVDALHSLDPREALARGLSRGTAAEGVAMALGAIAGGGLVSVSHSADLGSGPATGYGLAALAGALAALVYLGAVAALVHDVGSDPGGPGQGAGGLTPSIREVLATARAEAAASVTVRVVLTVAAAIGVSLTAVELLWQPRFDELIGGGRKHGLAFGVLAAGSMLAVALGAALSPSARQRMRLRTAYCATLIMAAVCVALLGVPTAPLAFAAVYLLAYLSWGLAEPLHSELLNDAVGSRARATLISAESLALQGGSLVANLTVGALAASAGTATAFAAAGAVLAVTVGLVSTPLRRAPQEAASYRP